MESLTATKIESGLFTDADRIKPEIFALMFRASSKVLKNHHADLYHDINFLRSKDLTKLYHDGIKIYWSVRESGTHIGIYEDKSQRDWIKCFGPSEHYVVDIAKSSSDLYRVTLSPCLEEFKMSNMKLNRTLDQLGKSIEVKNLWDVEAYAVEALEVLELMPENFDKSELRAMLQETISSVHSHYKQASDYAKYKKNLIEEIVNFKG